MIDGRPAPRLPLASKLGSELVIDEGEMRFRELEAVHLRIDVQPIVQQHGHPASKADSEE